MPARSAQAASASSARPSRAVPLALFLLLAIAIAAAGALSYVASAPDLRRQKEDEIAAIAVLKVEEIERWRAERLADADAIAANPILAAATESPRTGAGAALAKADVERWFEALHGSGECSPLALVSSDGEVRFTVRDLGANWDAPDMRALIRRAIVEERPLLSDLHRHGKDDPLHFTIAAPVRGERTSDRWCLLVRVDPYRWFFRMIQSWPVPSPSAETLVVRVDGTKVRFENELRHFDGDPTEFVIPLERFDSPAVRAASGQRGVVHGIDYRGMRVVAAIEPIPDSSWTLVAKMDAREAFARLAGLRIAMAAIVAVLLLAAAAGAAVWWRMQLATFAQSGLLADAERRSLARRLEHLTKSALDLVLLADADLRIVEANDRAVETLGYGRDELIGMPVRALRDPETAADFDERARTIVEKGSLLFETRYRRKDGTTFPVEMSVRSDDWEGRRYFQAIMRDISERKRAEEAIRASEAKFRAAFEFAGLGIVLVDPDGRIVETNRAFRSMVGRGDEPLRGVALSSVYVATEGPNLAEILGRMRDGKAERIEQPWRCRRADGTAVETIQRASALRDEAGALRFMLCVVEDVTEKLRLEAQLMVADRMASVGTLAAGVAHEINNPLSFIVANLDFVLAELGHGGADGEVLRALQDAKAGGVRVGEIVRDLKAFSKPETGGRVPVDVRNAVQSAIALASNEIRHRARLVVDTGSVPDVLASEHHLAQVLVNLLVNAGQAIPEGNAAQNVVRISTSTAPDGSAVIEISDTGVGIRPEHLPRIFDPFFTTKPVGVGTGLGLSICHGIVTGLGGRISAESTPGAGSTFRVVLPAAAAEEPVLARVSGAPKGSRRGRILVVDDEILVGRAITRILSPAHDVVSRTSAKEALDEIGREGAGFDAMVCDLMMPEMTGMELHARVVELVPELAAHTIFLTGGAFTPVAVDFLQKVPNERLEKPFEPGVLRDLVARVLSPPAADAAHG